MDAAMLSKKSSIVLVLKILEEYSDDNHYLTQNDIVAKIEHNYGLELDRKSVGSSLSLLEEIGYEIEKGPKGGFALLGRTLDVTEVSYLIDAIFSSRSIPGNLAKKLAKNVSSCLSKYQRKNYDYLQKSTEVNRTENLNVLYNVSLINEAVSKGKQISFKYLEYDKEGKTRPAKHGYVYKVSPYHLVNNFGKYYLLCSYNPQKYGRIQTYRVDMMEEMNILEEDRAPLSSLKYAPKDFSISTYVNEHIYLFNSEVVYAKLELSSARGISYVKDWFGEKARITNKDGKIYAEVKCDKEALKYWCMQYGEVVTVLEPESLVEEVKESLGKALEKYK